LDNTLLQSLETLSPQQQAAADPHSGRLFLEGPSGCGKSTAGVARFQYLIADGIPADQILILVPQRTLAFPYYQAVHDPNLPSGSLPDIATFGGLGQRLIDLFWPEIAGTAGFLHPERSPAFLTLETAQYYLAGIVDPLIKNDGYFESVSIDHYRLLSQILDNLNKSAAVGFEFSTLAERLKSAYSGKGVPPRVFDEAQEVGLRFRDFCLENSLLDFSLQVEIFAKIFRQSARIRDFLFDRYRHLIFDNLEEDVPVVHSVLEEWLPEFDSALLIYDRGGGFRTFLGADPEGAYRLKTCCEDNLVLDQSFIITEELASFCDVLTGSLTHREQPVPPDLRPAVRFSYERYLPQTVDWVGREIQELIEIQGLAPRDIVILAPFMSDSLRFSLMDRLEANHIPARSHRPSRSLSEEPATHCLLTLAKLAHPQWGLKPSRQDVRAAFMQSFANLDLVRADLLTRIVYSETRSDDPLSCFENILPEMRDRITFYTGERYEQLRTWLQRYRQEEPAELDVFLSRLFGEVLSQEGFGFHDHYDSAAVAARLVESVQKFRRGTRWRFPSSPADTGKEYIRMVQEGVLAAQYLFSYDVGEENAVLIAPAYTYIMANRPVRCQFWLDVGSLAWWERLSQPLTHPYVLSNRWKPGAVWTDADDIRFNQEALARLVGGLIQHCSERIYLCATGISEDGNEQKGPLLQALQQLIRHYPEQMGVVLV
jgi:hypothetical protein